MLLLRSNYWTKSVELTPNMRSVVRHFNSIVGGQVVFRKLLKRRASKQLLAVNLSSLTRTRTKANNNNKNILLLDMLAVRWVCKAEHDEEWLCCTQCGVAQGRVWSSRGVRRPANRIWRPYPLRSVSGGVSKDMAEFQWKLARNINRELCARIGKCLFNNLRGSRSESAIQTWISRVVLSSSSSTTLATLARDKLKHRESTYTFGVSHIIPMGLTFQSTESSENGFMWIK